MLRPIRITAVAALGAAALIAPAAAGAAEPDQGEREGVHHRGVPKTLKHGVKYTVTLANKGKFPHDLLFDGKGVHDVGIHNKTPVAPGKSASFTVTFPKAGKFEFYCAIKGHAAKGMKGEVKVT